MHITFKTFKSGLGDCIFLLLKQGEVQFSVMVDCGKLTDEIASYIENDLKNTINLLIVTHIDNDHIEGLVDLMQGDKKPKINKILFNCYHRETIDNPQSLSEKQQKVFEELKRRCSPTHELEAGKINAKEAVSLSECILKDEAWTRAWQRKPVLKGDVIDLDGGFGKITILSPLPNDLNLLEAQFKKEFWAKFYDKYAKQYKKEESLYEVLLRVWESTLVENRADKVGYAKLTKDAFVKVADNKVQPVTLPNRCSIAFVYEYCGHYFLLMGDADPGIVTKSLEEYYKDKMPMLMDLIKVSHHGSSHSTTKDLVKVADSADYYFTGGNREERPSLETLSRIITSPLNGQAQRMLHFNRKNQVLKDLLDMPELAEFPCSIDLDDKQYEIEI